MSNVFGRSGMDERLSYFPVHELMGRAPLTKNHDHMLELVPLPSWSEPRTDRSPTGQMQPTGPRVTRLGKSRGPIQWCLLPIVLSKNIEILNDLIILYMQKYSKT